MRSRLKTRRGRTLYDFWSDRIARHLAREAQEVGAEVLVNCASQEYFGAVDANALGLPVITPQFYEMTPGGPKIVSFYAKRARGAMACFVCERRLGDPAALEAFDLGGYAHAPELSAPGRPAFLREDG